MTVEQTNIMKISVEQVISKLKELYGSHVTSSDIRAWCAISGNNYQTITNKIQDYKVERGKWNLDLMQELNKAISELQETSSEKVNTQTTEKIEHAYKSPAVEPSHIDNTKVSLVPEIDTTFVRFGNFTDIKKIIESNQFYPAFITGLSGNGKTFAVEQACARLKREMIRVNITIETDEDDLIGGFRLINGDTVWHNGPVIEALDRGAILLLDEIDLASNKILCLQSILEGKGVFLKKIGRWAKPKSGFNVIATANTKGKGSDDGRFIGTNVMNEAFLERFPVTFEQPYPSPSMEKKILVNISKKLNMTHDDNYEDFCARLVDWGDVIRKTFYDGGVDEIISTRRLTHIIRAYSIFKSKEKAIKVCLNRFDDETKQSFLELYDKIDADFNKNLEDEQNKKRLDLLTNIDDEFPF